MAFSLKRKTHNCVDRDYFTARNVTVPTGSKKSINDRCYSRFLARKNAMNASRRIIAGVFFSLSDTKCEIITLPRVAALFVTARVFRPRQRQEFQWPLFIDREPNTLIKTIAYRSAVLQGAPMIELRKRSKNRNASSACRQNISCLRNKLFLRINIRDVGKLDR